jgi:hypothetical protein
MKRFGVAPHLTHGSEDPPEFLDRTIVIAGTTAFPSPPNTYSTGRFVCLEHEERGRSGSYGVGIVWGPDDEDTVSLVEASPEHMLILVCDEVDGIAAKAARSTRADTSVVVISPHEYSTIEADANLRCFTVRKLVGGEWVENAPVVEEPPQVEIVELAPVSAPKKRGRKKAKAEE